MVMHRNVYGYIITYYLPSGLFVIVSWISFLIPFDVIPGRMTLLVTLFLVLINIFNAITTNIPKAEGLTAIEVWMLICILFVFGALAEYTFILFNNQTAPTNAVAIQQLKEEYLRNDKFFLVFFPALFLGFNIFYWTHFLEML